MADTLATRLGADLAAAAPFYGGAPSTQDIPKIKAAILVHQSIAWFNKYVRGASSV